MIWDVHPGSGSSFFHIPNPGSRGQKGTGSRIQNTEKNNINRGPQQDAKSDWGEWVSGRLLTWERQLVMSTVRARSSSPSTRTTSRVAILSDRSCSHNKRKLPSNAHISTPFFQKTVFLSKIFFGKPPSKFLEVCLNS
jgi:hypothetical protein